jgi:glutathione S-transferase
MTDPMVLLYAEASPFARKVRIVAAEVGISLSLTAVHASPLAGRTDVTQVNPLGKIPALVVPEIGVLYDSSVICRYLGQETDLYPAGSEGWRALRREALADGLMEAALLARYETTLRPEALRWQDWIDGQVSKIRNALVAMEAEISPSGTFDIGNIATACALGYLDFRFAALYWRKSHPGLADFAATLHQRPSVRESAPS